MLEDAHEMLLMGNLLQYDTEQGGTGASAPVDESMVYDGMDFSNWDAGRKRMNG